MLNHFYELKNTIQTVIQCNIHTDEQRIQQKEKSKKTISSLEKKICLAGAQIEKYLSHSISSIHTAMERKRIFFHFSYFKH